MIIIAITKPIINLTFIPDDKILLIFPKNFFILIIIFLYLIKNIIYKNKIIPQTKVTNMIFYIKIYNYLLSQTRPYVLSLPSNWSKFIFINFTSEQLFLNQSTEGFIPIVLTTKLLKWPEIIIPLVIKKEK